MRILGDYRGHRYRVTGEPASEHVAVEIVSSDAARSYAFELANTLSRDWPRGITRLVESWIDGAIARAA